MGNRIASPPQTKSIFHLDKNGLSEEEILFLLENTKFSREQILEFYSNFLRDCPHGFLTKRQFLRIFKTIYQNEHMCEKSEKFCEYIFKAIDRNSKNFIEFSDFITYFYITSFGSQSEKIELAFKIFDLNKDNVIERSEFRRVFEALLELTCDQNAKRQNVRQFEQQLDVLIKRLDKNGNRIIEFDEFFNGCLEDDYIADLLVNKMFNC
ncbi:Neuronal calcium sensor 2 [Brachionus plicatilis]|uniref:Neuronal calcium sensor 2 n=1 Tax=Brachionus plicatilis TaxID=10195 RepID=A0A3M7PDP2_BRAPC|nr:Neuronal calcium sensor 2 [Brachionus plicatilis]